jgi:homoserine kinase
MSVTPPAQEKQNRKILEQLEEQKKRLRLQTQQQMTPNSSGVGSIGAASASLPLSGSPATVTANPSPLNESQHMNAAQRAALQHAHANSVGYFITQDSAFGNLILPVLPRFDK